MPDSLKKQIRDALLELVQPLRETLSLRKNPAWSNDPMQILEPLPTLLLYAGDTLQVATDNRGRTRQFPVTFKFCFGKARADQLEDKRDECVAALSELIESDIQLGSLVTNVTDSDEEHLIQTTTEPIGVVLITYTIEYRHPLGDPVTAY